MINVNLVSPKKRDNYFMVTFDHIKEAAIFSWQVAKMCLSLKSNCQIKLSFPKFQIQTHFKCFSKQYKIKYSFGEKLKVFVCLEYPINMFFAYSKGCFFANKQGKYINFSS